MMNFMICNTKTLFNQNWLKCSSYNSLFVLWSILKFFIKLKHLYPSEKMLEKYFIT